MHQHQRAQSALAGALLADALGVPHEFKPAESIPADIQLVMPPSYRKTYHDVRYGTWSDDGSQMMCLLQSLADNAGMLDSTHFGEQLVRWWRKGWHQAGGVVFDCGATTGTSLSRLEAGIPATKSGSASGQSLGNGSLMRVLPAAISPIYWGRPATDVIAIAAGQSVVTHAHPVAQMCCAIYAHFAYGWLIEPALPISVAVTQTLQAVSQHSIATDPSMQDAIQLISDFISDGQPSGSGYCVSTLATAIWCVEHNQDYLSAIRAAIRLGGDTDTVACATGGLAAIRYGLDSVPDSWWVKLVMPFESRQLMQAHARASDR